MATLSTAVTAASPVTRTMATGKHVEHKSPEYAD
jgi:hypothetical protein